MGQVDEILHGNLMKIHMLHHYGKGMMRSDMHQSQGWQTNSNLREFLKKY